MRHFASRETGEDVQQVGMQRKIGSDVVSVADVLFECAPLPLAAAGSERGSRNEQFDLAVASSQDSSIR